ncbi:aa3-type cytochrome c oxidase subunit IV [Chelativorans sp. SCAU2101]|jgi:Bacterial aa3 type cytochrome c oxidase subunit IV.|uniref:Aa3-type cytochrome c oxidase subunit IV n=1 Tax=Chelativorans petroleitrophicus TaxID=2975484 RepID=A0A9X2X8W4_9HYPH|nr:aa3-type cytochrome c oxidase subunit IV [Chelativorans petroleitrophicus]MCT8989822.1 aa3-type cytochrome c oxidase subunit IV [Chelativorans petroleitrophicus]
MAEKQPDAPAETGAIMDYEEHERTYKLFLTIAKYACLVAAALLIAMAFGFFTSAGLISSTILFLLICALGYWILG